MTVTPRGSVFLAGASALLIAGLLKIDGVLIALSMAGFLVAILAISFGFWNLGKLIPEVHAPPRVYAETPFDLRLGLTNRRPLFDAYSIEIELIFANSAALRTHAKWTAAKSSSVAKLRGSLPGRGAHSKHPCRISSTFPLDLFRFSRKLEISREILVFPRALTPLEFFTQGEFDDAWNGSGWQPGDAPGEPRGLRPFRPGDRAHQLHWPASIRSLARGRNLRVREFDPPGFRPREATLLFHSFGTDNTLIRTDLFERALSLVCGSLKHLRRIGVPATLRADFLDWRATPSFQTGAWSELLVLLARARRTDDTEAHDLIEQIESVPSGHALMIVSDMPPQAWQHILPDRKHLVINVNQHRHGRKSLSFSKIPPRRKGHDSTSSTSKKSLMTSQ